MSDTLSTLFPTCLAFTGGIEAGYSSRASDPGNYYRGMLIGSNKGISAPVAAAWLAKHQPGVRLTAQWMREISDETVSAIAKGGYWDCIMLDGLAAVSPGLALSVFDHGYNRGPVTSGALFQAMIGIPETDPKTMRFMHDGVIGAETVASYASADLLKIGAHLNTNSSIAVQQFVGARPDGVYGPVTNEMCEARGARNVVTLYALRDVQRFDYSILPGVKANPGWLTRADSRLKAALALENKDSSNGSESSGQTRTQ